MHRLGLVLSGGGAKGAYEIGVWKALNELGLSQMVREISCTSIGALNALLFLRGDWEDAMALWLNLKRSDIAPINFRHWRAMLRRRSLSEPIVLQGLINQILKKTEIPSNINVNIAYTEINAGFPIKRFYNLVDGEHQKSLKLITASCSIPLVFKGQKLKERRHVYLYDGGIRSRTPVEGLSLNSIDIGIIVHVDSLGKLAPLKFRKEKFINIYPSKFLGGLVNGTYGFSSNQIIRSIELGYQDGIKALSPLKYRLQDDSHAIQANELLNV